MSDTSDKTPETISLGWNLKRRRKAISREIFRFHSRRRSSTDHGTAMCTPNTLRKQQRTNSPPDCSSSWDVPQWDARPVRSSLGFAGAAHSHLRRVDDGDGDGRARRCRIRIQKSASRSHHCPPHIHSHLSDLRGSSPLLPQVLRCNLLRRGLLLPDHASCETSSQPSQNSEESCTRQICKLSKLFDVERKLALILSVPNQYHNLTFGFPLAMPSVPSFNCICESVMNICKRDRRAHV